MTSDLTNRPRRNFGDFAKLASIPDPASGTDRDEGSGLIHLASLEATERAVPPPSALTVEPPAEAPQRDRPTWRPVLAGVAMLGAGLLGVVLGSTGATSIRGSTKDRSGVERPVPAAPLASAAGPTRRDGEVAPLKLPLVAESTGASDVGTSPPPSLTAPSSPPAALRDPQAPSERASAPASARPRTPAAQDRAPGTLAETEAAPPPSASDSLGDRMRKAVGAEAPAQAKSNDDAIAPPSDGVAPEYPSIGAINSALRKARQEAEACVEGDVPISHANVTFSSTGVVQSVAVSGWAAGKPAETCVREALTKVRVAPFLQSSYVVPVTIRSN